jgi:putative type I restriction-modification system, specificity determinant; restriction endonuclease
MDMQSKAKNLIEMIQTASVEWKPLGEVVPISRGKRLVRSQLQDSGQYPVYQNSLQPLGFYDDQNCRAYMTFVIAAGAAGEIGFSDIEFWAADDCYYFNCPKEILHDKFLYYFLLSERHQLTSQIRKASVPRLGRGSIEKIKIPIPSLEIQQKIVKILDKFTELEATLEAELALRKRQYRYYRDFILDFDNQIGGGWIVDSYKCRLKDVVWKTLGEVVNIKNGKDWKNFSSGDIPVYGSGGVMGYVDTFAYDKPSVLIPRKGSITNIFYVDFPFWNVDTIYYTEIDTSKLKPKFFYYFMRTIDLMALDTGSGRPSLTQTILNKIKIPIPPLPEQEKIVAILDKFDTLTHSISEGLPYEIALRRKQYEYYREQLLAFPAAA